jgi:hypothetical protein
MKQNSQCALHLRYQWETTDLTRVSDPTYHAAIFEHVLRPNHHERLYLSDISAISLIARVCKQFAKEVNNIYTDFSLHMERVLGLVAPDRNLVY